MEVATRRRLNDELHAEELLLARIAQSATRDLVEQASDPAPTRAKDQSSLAAAVENLEAGEAALRSGDSDAALDAFAAATRHAARVL